MIADAKDELKLGIVLLAMAAEVVPDIGIDSFEGLKNGNGRRLSRRRSVARRSGGVSKEIGCGDQGEKVKANAANRCDSAHKCNG